MNLKLDSVGQGRHHREVCSVGPNTLTGVALEVMLGVTDEVAEVVYVGKRGDTNTASVRVAFVYTFDNRGAAQAGLSRGWRSRSRC